MTSAMGTPKTEIQLREQLAATMRPLNEAHTLPPHCYTSREFYELEVQKIFMKEWLGVGRVDQIENPGDYFCKDIADEPIVIRGARHADIGRTDRDSARHAGRSPGVFADLCAPRRMRGRG